MTMAHNGVKAGDGALGRSRIGEMLSCVPIAFLVVAFRVGAVVLLQIGHDLVSQLQPEIARGGKIGVYPVSELRIRLNLLLKARGDNDQRIDLLLIDQMIYHACRDITVIRVFLNIIPTVAALTKPVALIICAAVHQKQHVVFFGWIIPVGRVDPHGLFHRDRLSPKIASSAYARLV